MDIYREFILDHYKHPRNFGSLPHATHSAHAYNATCGDRINMELILESVGLKRQKKTVLQEKTRIKDIRFSGEGCAISVASASLLTEKVKGMTKEKIMKLNLEDIVQMIGITLTPSRIKCALLPLEVLQKGLCQSKGNKLK